MCRQNLRMPGGLGNGDEGLQDGGVSRLAFWGRTHSFIPSFKNQKIAIMCLAFW